MALPFRIQQWIVSTIGAFLFLPVYFFLGGLFSFSFAASDSMWAWGFNLTAFWCQIFGILASFFKPRVAAAWMLVHIALSVVMLLGCATETATRTGTAAFVAVQWMKTAPGVLRLAFVFWAAPLALAFLLLRTEPPGNSPQAKLAQL